ncbi:ras/Rap GTPase-activating protein SynGAP-like [Anopheles nili]|uniref:ras/Rap GTPase-activating protein SynGAP-like n=1 Tax=Anopheles nili TaxID=185578 RepID=UPI00237BA199|nr:ras/Rap GTPase-activating protein SynGAP-like [Anopheles nili]
MRPMRFLIFPCHRPEAALESQLVSAFRAATLPDAETLDLRQPSPLSPGSTDPALHPHHHHHHHLQQQQHHHHHHHGGALGLPEYSRKRSHRHSELPAGGFFPGSDLVPGGKKGKFSAAATAAAAAAAVAANYYDNAYLSFEKSLRGAFGGPEALAAGPLMEAPGGPGGGALEPYGAGAGGHLLSPINYTLTAEAINRRIRSTLGLDDPDPTGKGPMPDDPCCPGMASPDWMLRRGGAGSGPALAETRPYTHSPGLPPGTPGTLYEEHKFGPFSPVGAGALHDDNNNVDKKAFQE